MKAKAISTVAFVLCVIFPCSWSWAAYDHSFPWTASVYGQDAFLECLDEQLKDASIPNLVHTSNQLSYLSILQLTVQNLRFSSESTPKPSVIVTPDHESQIPPVIYCAKENDVQIRTRSGGHDNEGLSYRSEGPFVMIDLIHLSRVTVDVEEKTAWVEAGTNIGTLYYRIAEKSPTLGFPAGVCPTVGVGGHISGGGFGTMHRKYGLAADNVIDARIADVNGRILDRESMGEDMFWAIRGGGGSSFGVILAWKVQLVDVPERVTVFTVRRTLEQNATQLIHRWQYVQPRIDRDLFISLTIRRVMSSNHATILATFSSLFLGGIDRLLPLMQQGFPELGLLREDCREMSWIQSAIHFAWFPPEMRDSLPLEVLLNRSQPNNVRYFKSKSDFVQEPIPQHGLEGAWKLLYEPEAKDTVIFLNPFGGRMNETPESAIAFPHRAGNLFCLQYWVFWEEKEARDFDRYIDWVRRLYNYMAPYVSRSPRAAYVGSRDLDIGVNDYKASYEQASIWGFKYFKNNFDRLVRVKTMIDPGNFFRGEQNFPSLPEKAD